MSKKNYLRIGLIVAGGLFVVGGSFLAYDYLTTPSNQAQASEVSSKTNSSNSSSASTNQTTDKTLSKEEQVKKRVRDNPEAGLEAIDSETLESSKKSIKTFPRFLVENELKRQLKEGYLTQKQYDQYIQILDDKDNGKL